MLERPELLVEEGLQAGLSAPLALGSSYVGSDLNSAVVIADPALLPSHFELVFENGKAALRAVAGEVVMKDGTWLAPGENIVVSDETSFTAGNTRFALRLPAPAAEAGHAAAGRVAHAAPTHARKNVIGLASGVVALAAVGMLGFTAMGTRLGRASPSATAHALHTATLRPAAVASLDQVMQGLRGRLDAAGLSALQAAPARDGSVIVQGTLFPAQMAAWAAVREWYDTEYGTGRVLVNQVLPAGAGPNLAISAVWAGDMPYVVDEHGDKLFVGAAVGSGWTIADIKPGHVLVQSGQQKVAIRY